MGTVNAPSSTSELLQLPSGHTNALAESVNALYKKEVIHQNDSWNDIRAVIHSTAEWVYWYNNQRLHSWCGHRPPLEFEQAYWQGRPAQPPAAA
jgi:putative transposase